MNPVVKSEPGPRRTRREQAWDTRLRIMRAAEAVFAEKGYSGARMADIAKTAGVAVQTVYFAFHTKPELVEACYEHAVLGPDRVPPPEQPWHREIMSARTAKAAIRAFAVGNSDILARAAVIDDIARSALHEPEIAEVRRRSEDLRRMGYEVIVQHLDERFGLRDGTSVARGVDLAMTLAGPQTYLQLLSYGWTPGEYAAWLAGTLEQQLLRPRARRSAG